MGKKRDGDEELAKMAADQVDRLLGETGSEEGGLRAFIEAFEMKLECWEMRLQELETEGDE